MFNTNLVLPLLALGLYSHCHNINLANNTSLLIIVLALALQQREINKIEDGITSDNTNVYRRTTNTTYNNLNGQTTYTTASNFPNASFPYTVNCANGNCGYNYSTCYNNGCGGNCCQTYNVPYQGHCYATPCCGNNVVY